LTAKEGLELGEAKEMQHSCATSVLIMDTLKSLWMERRQPIPCQDRDEIKGKNLGEAYTMITCSCSSFFDPAGCSTGAADALDSISWLAT